MGDWRKSSHSGTDGGNCVEMTSDGGAVLVRDTTDRAGGTLAFSPGAWAKFTTNLK